MGATEGLVSRALADFTFPNQRRKVMRLAWGFPRSTCDRQEAMSASLG